MADPMGIYDQLLNGVYSNASVENRKEAESDLFKVYDNIWSPVFQEIMPRSVAPNLYPGGPVPSVNDEFYENTMVDPQTMAAAADMQERTTRRNVGFGKEFHQGRLFHENGPETNPFEFTHELKSGFLSRRNQMLAQNAVRSINRRIEYELVSYVRGSESVLNNYGDQYTKQIETGRQKIFDANQQTTTHAQYLNGKRIDESDSDLQDMISEINLYMGDKYGDATKAYVGNNASHYIGKNAALKDFRKYHKDMTSAPMSMTIDGVQFIKVKGQSYKDNSLNAARVGYPGLGSQTADTFTNRTNKRMMMDYNVTLHETGTADTEWAIFVSGDIGKTFNVATNPKHKNVKVPYVHSWKDPELEFIWTKLQIGICPSINDFSSFVCVNNFSKVKL